MPFINQQWFYPGSARPGLEDRPAEPHTRAASAVAGVDRRKLPVPFRVVARDRIVRKGAPTGAVASHDPLTHKLSAGRVHESRKVQRLHASNFSFLLDHTS
jgi:hypothetical protein